VKAKYRGAQQKRGRKREKTRARQPRRRAPEKPYKNGVPAPKTQKREKTEQQTNARANLSAARRP
jgi:hypothetical protein